MQIEESQVLALTMSQKIHLLEMVSDALCREAASFPSPEWHDEVLQDRAKELSNRSCWMRLDEVRELYR